MAPGISSQSHETKQISSRNHVGSVMLWSSSTRPHFAQAAFFSAPASPQRQDGPRGHCGGSLINLLPRKNSSGFGRQLLASGMVKGRRSSAADFWWMV
jgi:hypothetical protein